MMFRQDETANSRMSRNPDIGIEGGGRGVVLTLSIKSYFTVDWIIVTQKQRVNGGLPSTTFPSRVRVNSLNAVTGWQHTQ